MRRQIGRMLRRDAAFVQAAKGKADMHRRKRNADRQKEILGILEQDQVEYKKLKTTGMLLCEPRAVERCVFLESRCLTAPPSTIVVLLCSRPHFGTGFDAVSDACADGAPRAMDTSLLRQLRFFSRQAKESSPVREKPPQTNIEDTP